MNCRVCGNLFFQGDLYSSALAGVLDMAVGWTRQGER